MLPFEKEHIEKVRRLAAECTVLLKSDGTLPLSRTGRIAAYGNGVRRTVKGGSGSGDVNVRHFVTIEEGLENAGFEITTKGWLDDYDLIWEDARKQFVSGVKELAKQTGVNPVMLGMGRTMAEPEYEIPIEADGDTAVYVLSRLSGEGSDRRMEAGDISLTQTEIRDILRMNKKYKNFILVLNVGGLIDLEPVKEVKNILLLSQLGTATGDVLADILLGKSYPSGKMAMTWAPIDQYPSTEGFGDPDDTLYREGIYIGYRYFDTVGKKVSYPFGYGLGFTKFKILVSEMAVDAECVKMKVVVRNTGDFRGKEVVQIYVSSPQGRIDHPYQELKAFSKTKELVPGEEQLLEISFCIEDIASYDINCASYRIEKGDYIVRAGTSSANAEAVGVLRFEADILTEKVRNICSGWGFEPNRFEKRTLKETTENLIHINVPTEEFLTKKYVYSGASAEIPSGERIVWNKVQNGENTVDDFISGLTSEELIYLCLGFYDETLGSESIIGSACVSVAGAAGETTARLKNMHLPTLTMADGPAGIRVSNQYKIVNGKPKAMVDSMEDLTVFMDDVTVAMMKSMVPEPSREEIDAPMYYSYCTAIPIGTALAQSWNPELGEIFGDIIGTEMEMFGVNYWLAPAMNIQRSPLCGRNFEYYSEDPLISGKMGAAITRGVQRHKGCATTIKHFACNNQETNRCASNSAVDERALREIYLKSFEICIKESQPRAMMTSYNLINGVHTCNSRELLTNVLRDEWGYQGIVMTDWYSTQDVMASQNGREDKYPTGSAAGCIWAGNDLIMPGGIPDFAGIRKGLTDETDIYHITRAELQTCGKRILGEILELSQ